VYHEKAVNMDGVNDVVRSEIVTRSKHNSSVFRLIETITHT